MPFATVKLKPGINVEYTPVLNEAGYSQSQFGRFKAGLFQKIGGWTSSTILSSNLSGIPKDLHAWQDINTNKYLIVGTTTALNVINNKNAINIIPQTTTDQPAGFSIVGVGSPLITVTDLNVTTITTDDAIYFNTPVQIGNIILSGYYPVNQNIGSNQYYINSGINATTIGTQFTATIAGTVLNVSAMAVGSDAVYVGQLIYGAGVTAGTYITSFGTGAGGAGTYNLSTSSTVAVGVTMNAYALPSFTVANGSPTVTVNLRNHGLSVGSNINFPIATTNSNVTIQGTYILTTAPPSSNTFTITANTSANASTTFYMNSNVPQLNYYLILGPPTAGSGWSFGGYSSGGYSTGSSSSGQSGTAITATNWSLDNFGSYGIATPSNGPIYYYSATSGYTTAQLVPNAPTFNGGAFVAMPQQQIVAWGSSTSLQIGSVQDPLLLRWCDVGDFTNWTAASTNQAGSYRLSSGSYIVGAIQGPQNGLIWTDLDLWAMSYIGQPLIYAFNKIGTNCGLIGQHAMATLLGGVYWMGNSNFFRYAGGGIEVIPCPVWDAVFQNLSTTNKSKSIACANTPFNEIWWFYPSTNATENDSYVKYNIVDDTWDYGSLGRTAWTDQSVLGPPIATTSSGGVYQHELTNDADGVPITSSLQTGYWMLAEGEELAFVDWILPDFKWGLYGGTQNANLQITIFARDYPGDTPRTFGPYTVNQTSQYINTRIRARYMAIKVESSDLGSFWRLGGVKYRWSADGRR